MKNIVCCLFTIAFVAVVSAEENPLAKSFRGDWAKYLITTKNETTPLLSSKDSPRWILVSNLGDGFVRTDSYVMFGGRRSNGGGNLYHTNERFEPVPGIVKSAKVEIVSTSKEKLTIKDKQYTCTKIVRKIDQPLDENSITSSWSGTSTLWICNELPLGLAKMENAYESKMSKKDKGEKVVETWMIDEASASHNHRQQKERHVLAIQESNSLARSDVGFSGKEPEQWRGHSGAPW